jgi:uncharacterized membrane protein YfhO
MISEKNVNTHHFAMICLQQITYLAKPIFKRFSELKEESGLNATQLSIPLFLETGCLICPQRSLTFLTKVLMSLSTLEIKISFAIGEEEKNGLIKSHGTHQLIMLVKNMSIGTLMVKPPVLSSHSKILSS